jgi:hypothetical protein
VEPIPKIMMMIIVIIIVMGCECVFLRGGQWEERVGEENLLRCEEYGSKQHLHI